MTLNTSRYGRFFIICSFLLLAVLCIWGMSVLAATVEIGRDGGKVVVESDLEILLNNGGGHVTWRISGEAAPEIRRIIDKNYGNNDGTLTPAEAQQYTSALDNYLTLSGTVYHGGKLQSFSLLDRNRGVEDNTNFLVGNVNDSRTIEIRFLLEATLSTTSHEYTLNDDIMVRGLMESLKNNYDTNTYLFVGKVEMSHMNYMVGMESFSGFSTDHGRIIRFRGPIWEIYQYTVTYDGGSMGKRQDKAKFDTFNVLESPLELFILLAALTYFMFYIPKRYAKTGRKQKIKSLHRGTLGLAALMFVVYFFGAVGLAVWILGPLFFILIFVLSYKIYLQGWKGWAKPLSLHESRELDREEGIVRPESYRKIQQQRYYQDEEDTFEDERPALPKSRGRPQQVRRQPSRFEEEGSEDEGGPLEGEEDADVAPVQTPPRKQAPTPSHGPRPATTLQQAPPRPVPSPKPTTAPAPIPAPKPLPQSTPAAVPPGPPAAIKKIRCVQCKQIFSAHIKSLPQKVQCPVCGKSGQIK